MDCSAASKEGTTPSGLCPEGKGSVAEAVGMALVGPKDVLKLVQPAPTAATPPARAEARAGRP
eukprot:1161586-Pelagomonas_calceolata.AAC.1